MPAQSIRRSQYIITYGPGAILEGPNGPRIVPVIGNSRVFNGDIRVTDFEITDKRLSQRLLDAAGIVRIPSNAELDKPDAFWVYWTDPFPAWSLCPDHGILYHKTASDARTCPRCRQHSSPEEAWEVAHRQAIRFVRACEQGHLDDVEWPRTVQHTRENCLPLYMRWEGGGAALKHVRIRCPECGASESLGTIYSRPWPCSGRLPERGKERQGCAASAKIVQRGAANLHMAELVTSLTIPPRETPLHRLFERSVMLGALVGATSKADLLKNMQTLVAIKQLKLDAVTMVDSYPESEIMKARAETLTKEGPATTQDYRVDEFEALVQAAMYGAPPMQSASPGAPPQFEVVQSQVRTLLLGRLGRLRVTPVNRLRVVMVQKGYRRLDPANSVVDCGHWYEERTWYPGVELFGEGIFLDIDPTIAPQSLRFDGSRAGAWETIWGRRGDLGEMVRPGEGDQFHPAFVWWHTLAHRLITALAVDSGYSSASVRERVFVKPAQNDGSAQGGVLLYTVQPGGDGTLGGLIALVPQFERVLAAALRNLDACSNDPLCGDEAVQFGRYNGAACYACAMVSETSCEHRNMYLDRLLLLEALS